MGQLIDLITAPEDRVDLSKFSLERYASRNIAWHNVLIHIYTM